ncbi:MAG: alanine--tRNA ligase [Patescibacteria group bacterium]
MKSDKIRDKFKRYFAKKLKHAWVASSSLVPENDPSVLLTTAGMQQFKPYFLGELSVKKDYHNRNLASSQKCFRTSDIDSVGDESHLTFFEMLGNFSLGGYFKDKAIEYAWNFLVKEMKIDKKRLWVTIFEGDNTVVKDFEAIKIWQKLVPKDKIQEFGRHHNWWGPPGKTGPCGPCSEIHYDLTEKPCEQKESCRPNCECGRFVEIWNLVFTEYYMDTKGDLKDLPTKNIDTGMGLERLAMIMQKCPSVFETDLFAPLMKIAAADKSLDGFQSEKEKNKRLRIVADHIKASVFLLADGVEFSNKDQGYILRRIFRRLIDQYEHIDFNLGVLVEAVISLYAPHYASLLLDRSRLLTALNIEKENYQKVLKLEVEKAYEIMSMSKNKDKKCVPHPSDRKITGEEAFNLYSTYGLTANLIRKKGFSFDEEEFKQAVEKHQQISRAGAQKKFGGVGDFGDLVARQHTATHLLHAALRKVLGENVGQMGSDLNPERLRFDFSYSQKLTEKEKLMVETIVNEKIKDSLPVSLAEMTYEQAISSGALAFFKEKYPDKVKVYTIGDFSKEICAGPHVKNTSELISFKIVSEKSSSAGVRRIKAILGK